MNQLRQIFDRVDVVMRRRRDERNAHDRVPEARDQVRDLMTRELTAFARLGALRDLDLELVGADEIRCRYAEAT